MLSIFFHFTFQSLFNYKEGDVPDISDIEFDIDSTARFVQYVNL